ncbi:MAG: NTPase [Conexivisphaerales archaeon]
MAEARLILITGIPGVGKTTLLSKVILELRKRGLSVGGVYSKEMREDKVRTGFVMTDLLTGFQKELASVHGQGPRMGRYRVNLKNLADFGAPALESAIQNADIIVIDEVGPMELVSPEFRRAVKQVMECSKPALIVIHLRMRDPLIEEIKGRGDSLIFEVTPENRNELASAILRSLKVVAG